MPLLADALKLLGLHHTAEHLDDLVALATKRRWSPIQLLEHLADVEQQERARRSLERRLLRSRLGRITPMTAFDWAWPTRIDRAAVEAALHLDFLTADRNCVLVAAQGLGKTMIAQNIAHQAILAGHHVLRHERRWLRNWLVSPLAEGTLKGNLQRRRSLSKERMGEFALIGGQERDVVAFQHFAEDASDRLDVAKLERFAMVLDGAL